MLIPVWRMETLASSGEAFQAGPYTTFHRAGAGWQSEEYGAFHLLHCPMIYRIGVFHFTQSGIYSTVFTDLYSSGYLNFKIGGAYRSPHNTELAFAEGMICM